MPKYSLQQVIERSKGWLKHPYSRIAVIIFIAISLYLIISAIVVVVLTKPDKEVKIPDVVDKRYLDIHNSLIRKGLTPQLKFYDVHDIDNDIILRQYPEPGEIVTENSTIRLLVSRSNLTIDMPSVVGMELPFALNKLKNLHLYDKTISLRVGVISYIPSEKTADNVVIDQNPKSGQKIPLDKKVNLLVSSGSATQMVMPRVAGQSIDLCYDLLMSKKVVVQYAIVPTNDISQSGIIASVTPSEGQPLTQGQVVTLHVYYYAMKDKPYYAYERLQYTVPNDEGEGLYEVYVSDNKSKRLCFSQQLKPGNHIDCVFNRTGNARVYIMCNKKQVKVLSFDVEEFD